MWASVTWTVSVSTYQPVSEDCRGPLEALLLGNLSTPPVDRADETCLPDYTRQSWLL